MLYLVENHFQTCSLSHHYLKIVNAISALNLKIADQNRDTSTSKKDAEPRGKDKKSKKKKSKNRKRRNSSSSSSSDSSDSSESSSGSDSDSSDSSSSSGKNRTKECAPKLTCSVLTELIFFRKYIISIFELFYTNKFNIFSRL